AECVKDLHSVFKPWIDSNGAETEQIINTVQKCPSGALSFSIDGVEYRNPSKQRNPMVTVSKNVLFV
ncbi:MAG: (4Fe-4S)-binding protein, partial [Nitrososphaeraceae archaeon]